MPENHSRRGFLARLSAAFVAAPALPAIARAAAETTTTPEDTPALCYTSIPKVWISNGGGSGYLLAPTITFSGGGGSGATCKATLGT